MTFENTPESISTSVAAKRSCIGHMLILVLVLVSVANNAAETRLPIVGTLGTGPAMDVAVEGDRAFVIGRGKLHVVDIREPAKPKVLGSLDGLGNTRQIVVPEGVAYVSAREFGLFIVDVREATPKLITHYDSIEFATGVVIAGKVLFIAQRQFGVELVDVTNPKHPRHLSTIRTGEAQSVVYHDGMLYTGVWGTSEVVTADVRDPLRPRIVSKVPLDGYGDGVFAHDGKLFAATGHHSRAPHANPDDPGYGMGHGMEIFSLADPEQPKFLGRVKFPRFYEVGNDMWNVQVVDSTAFVGDTHNGMFVVDVQNPSAPHIIAQRDLPKPAAGSKHAGYVGGFGLVENHIYVAGGDTELHIVEAKDLARPLRGDSGAAPSVPVQPRQMDEHTYRPDGQVHAVVTRGDLAVAACGSAGIHVLRANGQFKLLQTQPTRGVVTDVCLSKDVVFAAEGMAGLSVWRLKDDGSLKELGRYQVSNKPVKYVVAPTPGRFVLLEVGGNDLHIVDVTIPAQPKLALSDKRHGLLYGHQLCDQLLGGRYAAVFWHASGLHWYDLGGAKPVFAGQHPEGRFDMLNGVTVIGDKLVATRNGGFVQFDQEESAAMDSLPVFRVGKTRLSGKPTVNGRLIALADRGRGDVFVLDASDFEHPRLLEHLTLEGNPGRIAFIRDVMLIPAGYQGLIKRKIEKAALPKQ